MTAVADTGAQTCTAGEDVLAKLNCTNLVLMRTRHRLRAVNEKGLTIKGALVVNLLHGASTSTEILYICPDVKGIYLSQTALKNLKVLDKDFPYPQKSSMSAANQTPVTDRSTAPCGCPFRSPCPPIPNKLPLPATPEHRQDLEKWIKLYFASSAFNTCPHQKLQTMTGDPLNVSFIPNHSSVAIHKPIPVPHHWKGAVKAQLDADVALQIIEPVPAGTPTTWCSRMVTVPKKDGTPRRTVDLQNLNAATRRETHHTPSPFNIVSVVPPGQTKSVLDAWNGYHSVLLSPDARDATTFITEWGRYRYLRAPQGFHASNDGYTKRFDDITQDFPRVARCVDDSILWDGDIASSFWHTVKYIRLCANNGVVFNPAKFHFAKETVEFAGFDVTLTGYKPTQKLLKAIGAFPSPTNITGVRSWFGLVNQVSYAFAQAPITAPFRDLLKHNSKFYWDDTLEKLFHQSKQEVLRSIYDGVKTFETNRPTCLATDWSKTGLGFTLSQKHCTCPYTDNPLCGHGHWKIVYAGSRFTRPAESRYAPIEGESLALLFALESCKMFVMGCPSLLVAVDHKPLVRIFNDRSLDEIKNPRLLKIREKTLMYRFKVIAIPGNQNHGADAISRIPLPSPAAVSSISSTIDVEAALAASIQCRYNHDDPPIKIEKINQARLNDPMYQDLVHLIERGFPDQRSDVPTHLREFWNMRHDLYVVTGLVFLDGRVLIPQSLRRNLIDQLHLGHQGINSMKSNARRRFFWPGMGSQLQNRRDQCQRCNDTAPSNHKEPSTGPVHPDYPFQQTVTDIFHMAGRKYITYADRFSGWTEVASTHSDSNAPTICNILRRYFINFGVPEELTSDGGPPFNSQEFSNFLKSWGVSHRLSSAYYPQSNGRAEAAVKCMKRTLTTNISPSGSLDTNEVAKALLLHRNTPPPDIGASPAELLFGRPLHDHLPNPVRFRREWLDLANMREKAVERRFSQSTKNDTMRALTNLDVGHPVAIQNQHGNHPLRWNNTGTIVEALPHRQYRVLVDGSRRATLRNRRFIRPIPDSTRHKYRTDYYPEPPTSTNYEADHPKNIQLLPQGDSASDPPDLVPRPPPIVTASPCHIPVPTNTTDSPTEDTPSIIARDVDESVRTTRPTRTRRVPIRYSDYVLG